jgi:predicted dehydrogenase
MSKPLVNKTEISIAMLGMVDGNGHPYSWSAIINGYDKDEMKKCPFPVIPQYLGLQPPKNFGIPGCRVTHIWTDDPKDAEAVAKASLIPHTVKYPEDVIGKVDAVCITTDIGYEHVDRCKPFVEAGIPVFVDKPLTDNLKDLKTFDKWVEEGKPIMSSSCMRYTKEYGPYRESTAELGELRLVIKPMAKSWERYGIHAAEAVYPVLGPGFLSVRNTGEGKSNLVVIKHKSGAIVQIPQIEDMYGSFGDLFLAGTASSVHVKSDDTFYSFKKQLEAFVEYLRTGTRPFPYEETQELMKIIIAGILSKEQQGKEIELDELR